VIQLKGFKEWMQTRSLFQAIEQNNTDKVKKIIVSNSSLANAIRGDGWSLLHIASRKGNPEIVKLLITKGADINIKDNNGETPLHKAAAEFTWPAPEFNTWQFTSFKRQQAELGILQQSCDNRIETARLLISAGADARAVNNNSSTPIHLTVHHGLLVITTFKRALGLGPANPLNFQRVITAENNVLAALIGLLLSNGADINAKDKYGNTPLSLAIKLGQTEIAEMIRGFGGKE
jgi:ankyrin repeat protein